MVALLFVSLLFAVVDFGLLLNTWLAVSSGAREVARSASVGKPADFLVAETAALNVPALSTAGFSGRCCGAGSALELKVEYFTPCLSNVSNCDPVDASRRLDPSQLLADYGGVCGGSTCHPRPDDIVRVTLQARGAQVITPLIRPFFGCTDGSRPNCNVALTSSTIMRFEGIEF
jgi:TadE-like protein